MKRNDYDKKYKEIENNKKLSFFDRQKAYSKLKDEAKIQRKAFFKELRRQDKQVEKRLEAIDNDQALSKEDKAFLKEAIILLNAGSQSAAIAGIKRFGFDFTKMIGKGIEAARKGLSMKKKLEELYKNYAKDEKKPEDIPLLIIADLAERGLLFNPHLMEGFISIMPTFNRAQDFALTAFDKLLDTFVANKIPLPKEESKRLITVLKGITGALFSTEAKSNNTFATLLKSDEIGILFAEITRIIKAEAKGEMVEFNEITVLPVITKLIDILGQDQIEKLFSKELLADIKKIAIDLTQKVKKEEKKTAPKKEKEKEKEAPIIEKEEKKVEKKGSMEENLNFIFDQVENIVTPLSNNPQAAPKILQFINNKGVSELLEILFPFAIEMVGEEDKAKIKNKQELQKQGIDVKSETKLDKLQRYPELLKFIGANIDAFIGQLDNIAKLAEHEEFKKALENIISGKNVEIDWSKMQGVEKELFEIIKGLKLNELVKSDEIKKMLTTAISPPVGEKASDMQALVIDFMAGNETWQESGFYTLQNILSGLFNEKFVENSVTIFKEVFIDTAIKAKEAESGNIDKAQRTGKFYDKIFAKLQVEKSVSIPNILGKLVSSIKDNPDLKKQDLKVMHAFFLSDDKHRAVLNQYVKNKLNSNISLRRLNINTDLVVDSFKDFKFFENMIESLDKLTHSKSWIGTISGALAAAHISGSLGVAIKALLNLIASLIFENMVPKELKFAMIKEELQAGFKTNDIGEYLDKAAVGHLGAKEYYLNCRSLSYLNLEELDFTSKTLDQFNFIGAKLPNNLANSVITQCDFSRVEFYDDGKNSGVVNLSGAKLDTTSLISLLNNPKVTKIEGIDLKKFSSAERAAISNTVSIEKITASSRERN